MQYFQFIMSFSFLFRLVRLHIEGISGSIHWHTASLTLTAANISQKKLIKSSLLPLITWAASSPSGRAMINIAFFAQISKPGDGRRGFNLLHLTIRLLPACYRYATLHIPRGFAVRLHPAPLVLHPLRRGTNKTRAAFKRKRLHTPKGQGGKLDPDYFFLSRQVFVASDM